MIKEMRVLALHIIMSARTKPVRPSLTTWKRSILLTKLYHSQSLLRKYATVGPKLKPFVKNLLNLISLESENKSSNIQQIHTLKQKNQDLLNEIFILKEQNNALKNISEERDSYRTALQILTKKIHAVKEKDPSSTPGLADPDLSSTQPNTQRNRSNSTTSKKRTYYSAKQKKFEDLNKRKPFHRLEIVIKRTTFWAYQ